MKASSRVVGMLKEVTGQMLPQRATLRDCLFFCSSPVCPLVEQDGSEDAKLIYVSSSKESRFL